jgi:aminoglycoside phosphotransferase
MLPQRLRYTVYLGLLFVGKWLYGSGDRPFMNFTQRLPFNLYCKHTRVKTKEVLTTLFVAQNTTIPVPKILDIIDLPGCRRLVIMTRLPGQKPSENLSETSPLLLEEDLRNVLLQLRTLKPPSDSCVTGFPDGPCWQYSLATRKPIGPFPSINAFHDFILDPDRAWGDSSEAVLTVSKKLYTRNYQIRFTHGDLRPPNILVENGRLSGIVDWETAGWFPEYWERVSGSYAIHNNWRALLRHVFPQYDEEMEVHNAIWALDSTDPLCH